MRQHCCDQRRLGVLRDKGADNAIEFVEALDHAAPAGVARQKTLFVRLLRSGFSLGPGNLRIFGGERIPTVGVVWCAPANALPPQAEPGLVDSVDDPARTLVIRTDSAGDFSLYRLAIVASATSDKPPPGFDPVLSAIDFSFKAECRSDFDCKPASTCPPAPGEKPRIDYLARDYQGFRRLMLDRLSLLAPGWTERSAADVGMTLVELLAYVADNLAYRQDAVANEAYLSTARQRISIRRHARLVDYVLHEGCNARAFVALEVTGASVPVAKGTKFLTTLPGAEPTIAPEERLARDAIENGAPVFEAAASFTLDQQRNTLDFYTWGDGACCLPRGATRASLRGRIDTLRVGDFLIFEEVLGPRTFAEEDADPAHRWVVRLTEVAFAKDPSGGLFENPPTNAPVEVTEIAWDPRDALPFPLCVSVAERPGLAMSVARGNVVLVDHGLTLAPESLGAMPADRLRVAQPSADGCEKAPDRLVPARFRPPLSKRPLTHAFDLDALIGAPLNGASPWWPACALAGLGPRDAEPAIARLEGPAGTPWNIRPDLLESDGEAPDAVIETDNAGRAILRFGDGARGKRPDAGTAFEIVYRIGNGAAGNVGAESIAHIVSATDGIFNVVRNPLPAIGGVEPEDVEAARRDAPQAFRKQERAVTAADYAAAAERRADVQRAAATFRWTGSWTTVFVTPDRYGGGAVDRDFAADLRRGLERFRMAGYDLDVRPPRFVPLDIELHLCVEADYFRAQVLQAVRAVLSSGLRPDGALGLFHPDNFSFGEDVYLSRVLASAQAVEGVAAVSARKFQRLINPLATSLDEGFIRIGELEIAQLANNPNFRERGRLVVTAGGGK